MTAANWLERMKVGLASQRIGHYLSVRWRNLGALCYHLELLERRLRSNLGLWASERIVEYPWVLRNLQLRSGRVLDVGCAGSYLSHELIRQGHEVWGVDVKPYPEAPSKMKFCQVDIKETPFPDKFFDAIVAVSTVEHIWIGYCGEPCYPNGDLACMRELGRVLKDDGKLLMTLPYNRLYMITKSHRIYDDTKLKNLVDGFAINKVEYYLRNKKWIKTTREDAEKRSSTNSPAIVCLALVHQHLEGLLP